MKFKKPISRKKKLIFAVSSILILYFSSIIPVAAQSTDSSSTQTQAASTTAKKDESKKTKQSASVTKPLPAARRTSAANPKLKPLSTDEDPSKIGTRNINKGFTGWLGGSKEKEAGLGRQLAAEVEQQSKMVDDPIVTEYVNRVGQNIALHSDVKVPVTVKVIDSDDVNAFALPGGYLFVNKGLILAADDEDELAGVMAHELGHVAARHAMENQGKAQMINYGMLAGIIFGGPLAGQVLYNGGGMLQGLINLKFSRQAEEEADRLGVQYLYAAGYDPTGMATMFEKLAAQNKKKTKGVAKLLMDHPDSLDRRDSSLALVARFPEREEYVITTSDFQRVKNYLLKKSNARAATTTDIDDSTSNGKPTLKRRMSEPDSNTTNGTGDSSSPDGPPSLKRQDTIEPSTPTAPTAPSPTTSPSTKILPPTTDTTNDTAPKLKRRDSATPSASPAPKSN